MERAREIPDQRLEDARQARERLRDERRNLQRLFNSMMLERRALSRDMHNMAEATRGRRRHGGDA